MATITHDHRTENGARTREGSLMVVRPALIANPAGLGLAGFGLTTFALSFINAGIVSQAAAPMILALALSYGGLAQLLAGMWAFRIGDTFGAAAFSSYGAFWISYWVLNQFFIKQIPLGEQHAALALYLISWGVFTAWLWIASFRVSVAVNLVLLLLIPAYVLLGIGFANDSLLLRHIGGWFGIATAIVAWYTAFAVVTNSTFGRVILPIKEFD